MSCFRSSLSTTPVTSCCQTTGRIDASLRGQRAGGDRSLAVKLEPGKPSGDQAPIVFVPVKPTCLRSAGLTQALVVATVRSKKSNPACFWPCLATSPVEMAGTKAQAAAVILGHHAPVLYGGNACPGATHHCGSTVLLPHLSVLLRHASCNHQMVGRRQHRQRSSRGLCRKTALRVRRGFCR